MPRAVFEVFYIGILVGSAVLCVAPSAVRPGERVAWTVTGIALALYAAGNLYWSLVLSDLTEAPYPSLADALWLGFLPACYLGVLLHARLSRSRPARRRRRARRTCSRQRILSRSTPSKWAPDFRAAI
jgi:hypothetical protein